MPLARPNGFGADVDSPLATVVGDRDPSRLPPWLEAVRAAIIGESKAGVGGSNMRHFLAAVICAIAFLIISAAIVNADPDSCRDAVDQYKSAKSDVESALREYNSCIDGTDGHDDCSTEFSALQSAQDDFEAAVSEYEGECQ